MSAYLESDSMMPEHPVPRRNALELQLSINDRILKRLAALEKKVAALEAKP
jgi:hypothetical protein